MSVQTFNTLVHEYFVVRSSRLKIRKGRVRISSPPKVKRHTHYPVPSNPKAGKRLGKFVTIFAHTKKAVEQSIIMIIDDATHNPLPYIKPGVFPPQTTLLFQQVGNKCRNYNLYNNLPHEQARFWILGRQDKRFRVYSPLDSPVLW